MANAQDLTKFFNNPKRNNLEEYLNHCKKMGYKVYQEEEFILEWMSQYRIKTRSEIEKEAINYVIKKPMRF